MPSNDPDTLNPLPSSVFLYETQSATVATIGSQVLVLLPFNDDSIRRPSVFGERIDTSSRTYRKVSSYFLGSLDSSNPPPRSSFLHCRLPKIDLIKGTHSRYDGRTMAKLDPADTPVIMTNRRTACNMLKRRSNRHPDRRCDFTPGRSLMSPGEYLMRSSGDSSGRSFSLDDMRKTLQEKRDASQVFLGLQPLNNATLKAQGILLLLLQHSKVLADERK
ncbi:hypothetical protein HZH68_007485 [Vespula germanica]|uniref:Uncharacterized protein n=1 Tax=Vespula germanica TaxID=30212 RepID=A0A834K873_VESGE|nr:hypothetical protein HZH68_007485 [Vespula germanica]